MGNTSEGKMLHGSPIKAIQLKNLMRNSTEPTGVEAALPAIIYFASAQQESNPWSPKTY